VVCEQYYMGGAKPFGHLEGRCRQAFVTSLYSFWAKLRYIWLSLAFLNIKVDMGSGITWLRGKTSLVKLSLSLTRSSMLLISGSDQFESGFTLVEFDMVYVPMLHGYWYGYRIRYVSDTIRIGYADTHFPKKH